MYKTVVAQNKKQYLINTSHSFDDYFYLCDNFIYYKGTPQDVLIGYFPDESCCRLIFNELRIFFYDTDFMRYTVPSSKYFC